MAVPWGGAHRVLQEALAAGVPVFWGGSAVSAVFQPGALSARGQRCLHGSVWLQDMLSAPQPCALWQGEKLPCWRWGRCCPGAAGRARGMWL